MTKGDIYTVAGNGTAGFNGDAMPATSAELNFLVGLAVGPGGDLLIADAFNNRVRLVAVSSPRGGVIKAGPSLSLSAPSSCSSGGRQSGWRACRGM